MTDWKKILSEFAIDAENAFDHLKYRFSSRFVKQDPIMIQAYRGFGNHERLYVKGRVLENEGITPPEDNDSLWENILNMYRRAESDEIPFARVRLRYGAAEQVIVCDEEGFFEAWLEASPPIDPANPWQEVYLELIKPASPDGPPVTARASVLVPPSSARFGVISDIDDTVLQTHVTDVLRMARTVFLGNARTRLPFKGVAAFYRALAGGLSGSDHNPLFFVSSSPWNLYDLLADFFSLNAIPDGPILLRDWGISEAELSGGNHLHKVSSCQKIIEMYPDLPFILLGDTGQEDPEIYAELVARYPHRIQAIYIRNVNRDLTRPQAVRELAEKVIQAGSTLILADDTVPLAEHSLAQGWIPADALPDIREEKRADEAPPTPVEKLLGYTEAEQEGSPAPTVVIDENSKAETASAVKSGAIEEALQEGEKSSDTAPTIQVEGDDSEPEV